MATSTFPNIEFGICVLQQDGSKGFFRIPIDNTVRTSLAEMLTEFRSQYDAIPSAVQTLQLSEKYAANEKLHLPIDFAGVEWMNNFFQLQNIPVNTGNFSEIIDKVIFYFGIFYVTRTQKILGVKRPAQFKGLLRKKLFLFVDDTLQALPDNIFKLDNDFDFLIQQTGFDILHPSGFLFISKLEDQILATAEQSARQLATRIPSINFEPIAGFVGQSKTAAKLISSIRGRADLERTSLTKLRRMCTKMGIIVQLRRGQLIPDQSTMIDFLRLLDRREYDVDLTDDVPEVYVAASRAKKDS